MPGLARGPRQVAGILRSAAWISTRAVTMPFSSVWIGSALASKAATA
jgi:hypothetical protein